MPHLIVEYSENLIQFQDRTVLQALNHALISAGLFAENAIKARSVPREVFMIGTALVGHAFVHVKLSILHGRSEDERRHIAMTLADALRPLLPELAACELQACVEVSEIDRTGFVRL